MVRLILLAIVSILVIIRVVTAQDYVPPALEPWVPWVLERQPERLCPLRGQVRVCTWSGALDIEFGRRTGSFRFSVTLDKRASLSLPGRPEMYPVDVKVTSSSGGQPIGAPVVIENEKAAIVLEAGTYLITGGFRFDELPRSISIPPEIGIVRLAQNGKVVTPRITASGDLWLFEEAQPVEREPDTLSVELFRRIVDGSPFRVTSRLILSVSGQAREVNLGRVIPQDLIPIEVHSPIHYVLEKNGDLKLRLRPGRHELTIESLAGSPPHSLAAVPPLQESSEAIPEIWSWQPNTNFRAVEISGAAAIDPAATALPADWRGAATYAVSPSTTVTFNELRRGQEQPAPTQLHVQRAMWLDLDGGGYSIRDNLSGSMAHGWRLDALPGTSLERVTADGKELLITRNHESNASGIEVRESSFNYTAESYIDRSGKIPAVGWDQHAQSLGIQLYLPPGWRLLFTSGVDYVSGGWLSQWTLLDLFLMVLVAVGIGKVLSKKIGILTFVAFALLHGHPQAPVLLWVHVLIALALSRFVAGRKIEGYVRLYTVSSILLLLLVAASLAIRQVRIALYPHIPEASSLPEDVVGGLRDLVEASIFLWPILLLTLHLTLRAISSLAHRRIARAFGLFILAGGSLIALFAVASVTSFNEYGSAYQQAKFAGVPAAMEYADRAYQAEVLAGAAPDAPSPHTRSLRKSDLLRVDPGAVVQTGRGLPEWSWASVNLSWSGPVAKDHEFGMVLAGPLLNGLLILIQLSVLGVVCVAIARRGLAVAVFLAFISLGAPRPAAAQEFPSNELLQELEQRQTARLCEANCSAIQSMHVRLDNRSIHIDALVGSRGAGSIALPGPVSQFSPTVLSLHGRDEVMLRREAAGDNDLRLIARVPDGLHRLLMEAPIGERDVVRLQMYDRPLSVTVDAPGWEVEGRLPSGAVEGALRFSRARSRSAEAPLPQSALTPWFTLTRTFELTRPWTITTRLSRLGDTSQGTTVLLPLLEGERPTSGQYRGEDGNLRLLFSPGQRDIRIQSVFEERGSYSLSATQKGMTEVWKVACGTMWHCSFEGPQPISSTENGQAVYTWLPYPDETLKVSIARPEGMAGRTVTVERVGFVVTPGTRLTNVHIEAAIRSSQGGLHTLLIPEDSTLESVIINGDDNTSRFSAPRLSLPLRPGANQLTVSFTTPSGIQFWQRVPEVRFETEAANVTTQLTLPEERWLLFTGGPSWGAKVLFWPKLIVILAVAVLLGRLPISPLKTYQWVLLFLGLATLPVGAVAVPVLWLLAIEFRRRRPPTGAFLFNTLQVLLILLTLTSLGILYEAVRTGLILYPEMQVSGYGSSASQLRWYLDATDGSMPSAWALSVPIWVWRISMLAWAAWLALFIIKTAVWGFESFMSGGAWKGRAEETPALGSVDQTGN